LETISGTGNAKNVLQSWPLQVGMQAPDPDPHVAKKFFFLLLYFKKIKIQSNSEALTGTGNVANVQNASPGSGSARSRNYSFLIL
jgi:hypothetical protein